MKNFVMANTSHSVNLSRTPCIFIAMELNQNSYGIFVACVRIFQGTVDDSSLRIYLGIENNTKSGVRDGYSLPALVEVVTPGGVLNCTQPMPVWITWYNKTLRVGRGDLIGYGQLMSCDISSYGESFYSVGFANTHQNGGHFLIRRNAGGKRVALVLVA
jgi:hypothetical protein